MNKSQLKALAEHLRDELSKVQEELGRSEKSNRNLIKRDAKETMDLYRDYEKCLGSGISVPFKIEGTFLLAFDGPDLMETGKFRNHDCLYAGKDENESNPSIDISSFIVDGKKVSTNGLELIYRMYLHTPNKKSKSHFALLKSKYDAIVASAKAITRKHKIQLSEFWDIFWSI